MVEFFKYSRGQVEFYAVCSCSSLCFMNAFVYLILCCNIFRNDAEGGSQNVEFHSCPRIGHVFVTIDRNETASSFWLLPVQMRMNRGQ